MKISILLIFISAFNLLAEPGYSQSEKISLKLANVNTIEKVISEIEKSTDYVFIYNEDVFSTLNNEVKVEVSNQSIDEILNQLIKGTGLGYSLSSKQVTLYKDENKKVYAQITSAVPLEVQQPSGKTITGRVTDTYEETLPGVTVIIKGTTKGTTTDVDGNFSLTDVPENVTLQFSFVGMKMQEIPVGSKTWFDVAMVEKTTSLDEIIVVGYGFQKKASVVGAISQVTAEELLQSGGVTSVGEALQGRLPGLTTISGSGQPGENALQIFIRGQSSWNGTGQPLILVDGIEREMNDIDLNEIDQVSILKDASATAVFGVKGANGVILITTKRGKTGKAELSLSASTTMTMISKLPEKLDSYDAILKANESIMRELPYLPSSWNRYMPMDIADKYRNPSSVEESYIYPNVDWKDVVLKDFATDYRINLSVRGGTDFAKYFGSLSYQSVQDLFKGKEYPNGKGYSPSFTYNRFNYRSNLDFNITNTTKFSVNLSGYLGIQEKPSYALHLITRSIYDLSPAIYTPIYPDGYYGAELSRDYEFENPLAAMANRGVSYNNTVQVNSDFMLEQKLHFLTDGLSFNAKLSYDNDMLTGQQISDPLINGVENVIYRIYDGNQEIIESPPGLNDFDFVLRPWTISNMDVWDNTRSRRLNYEISLNYNRTFARKHNVSGLFLMKREEFAIGDMFKQFREDWVTRLTYDYDLKYFLDVNGAYNGSEKFGPNYRFQLFPSVAAGWMITNEQFMSSFEWLDKLKVRGSYGLVGDDNFPGRWKYITQWASGGSAFLVPSNMEKKSPYTWYKESVVGNPDLQWETAVKSNIGVEVSLWDNMITAEFDYFTEDRDNILIQGSSRSVPDFFGIAPPDANTGEVKVRGYELVLGANYRFNNGISTWAKYSYTDAKDEVISKEDPLLRPFYQKAEGYPIGQRRQSIASDLMTNWDDVYMSTPLSSNQSYRRIGYYDLVDYDADGVYNSSYDQVPYGYTNRPQITWNLTAGAGYKGVNIMFQLYGTQNSTRDYFTRSFIKQTYLFFEHKLGYWSKDNLNSTTTLPAWSLGQGADDPYQDLYDSSLVRLKTVEVSYDIPKEFCQKIGINGLRVFVNGNDLYLWSNMPDDREFNFGSDAHFRGDYPTKKRFNFGLNLNF